MAEKPAASTKRRVRNPETFRERAIKAGDDSGKPKRSARLKQAGGKVAAPIFRPLGKASSKIGRQKPVRVVAKPLRLLGKVLFPAYFRTSWRELRQVQWPSWQQSRQLTFAVLVFAAIFGAAIAIVDYGLDKLFRDILLK